MNIETGSEEQNPSAQSVNGLNGLLFFIADVRHGVGPLLSIHLKKALNWDPSKVGIALAAVEFSAFLIQIPAGLLADSAKRKRLIVAISCLLVIFGCLICLFFTSFLMIIIAQLIMGISVALISPALGSITLGLFGRKKYPSRAGKNEVFNHLGNVFAVFIAGMIAYWQGSQWIFLIIIFFALGCLLSLSYIRPNEINYAVARELPQESKEGPLPLSTLFTRSSVVIFNLSLIFYYMANGAQISLVGQILANNAPEKSAIFISLSLIIAEITMIIVAFIMSRIVNNYNRKTLFLIAFSILPIRALLYTLVENPYYFLAIQSLDGVAAGILGTMGTVINSDLAVNTGRFNFLQGVGAMSTNIGESISQLFAGFVATYFGYSVSFFSLAFIALVGIMIFAFLMPETKNEKM